MKIATRLPDPDIATLSTLPMRAVRIVPSTAPASKHLPTRKYPWWKTKSRGFWLRMCYLIFILVIEGAALGLLLLSTTLPAMHQFDTLPTPTLITYPCAHVTLSKASNGQWLTSTDYVCH